MISTARMVVFLGCLAASCAARQTATRPALPEAPSQHRQLEDLAALIEGPNTPEVRGTAARELLLRRWPEAPSRLVSLLSGSNGPAKVALANALSELPEFLDARYVDPLLAMLTDAEADTRLAAARTLAAYPNPGVTARLRALTRDSSAPSPTRLAAITALGLMTEREAVAGLVALLPDPDQAVVGAALEALEQATAMDFGGRAEAALAWWEETRPLSSVAWQQLQIKRLVRRNRQMLGRLAELEARLAQALETNFLRAADAERISLLAGYLSDGALTIRLLALRLAQLHLAEGRPLSPEVQQRVRELMGSPTPREQALAVQTVVSFREPRDADMFVDMLGARPAREVRLALLNGLGYVGAGDAAEVLLKALGDADEQCATEAVAALGRLAERGVLPDAARDAVVTALLGTFENTAAAQVALRERTLWAMGNVADQRFGPALAAALDLKEAVAVRQAAIRGMAVLKSPTLADALITATSDPDARVRKVAVETLVALGSADSDAHLRALWQRVTASRETDETIRQTAWRGVLDMLAKRPVETLAPWVKRLSTDGDQDGQRAIDLLERLAALAREARPPDHQRLGRIRALLAGKYADAGRRAEALAEYAGALADLCRVESDTAGSVAVELLRLALAAGEYNEQVATALAAGDQKVDALELWAAVKAEVEPLLAEARFEEALAMLAAIEQHPPGAWPADVLEELEHLRARAGAAQPSSEKPAAETQPARNTASKPAHGVGG